MTEEHTYLDNRITCEKLPSGAWQYSIDDRIRGEKFYPSADDAYSDAVDLLIILGWRGPLTAEAFRSLISALDATIVDGSAASPVSYKIERDSYTSK
jgi:hypothetical protein